MAYNRKTKDVYKIYGNYGYGGEVIDMTDTYKEAKYLASEYRTACRGVSVWVKRGRVPIVPRKQK